MDGWLAECLSRGHPLGEAAHTHWAYAPLGASGRSFVRAIDRTSWPMWVSPDALAQDFRLFLKNDNWKMQPMPASLLAKFLQERGLYPLEVTRENACRVQFEDEDPRTRRKIKKRIRLVRCMDREALADYLKRRHGFEVEAPDKGDLSDETHAAPEWNEPEWGS